MISMMLVFLMFVMLFSIMGFMRGWAKELLVTISVLLALAFLAVLQLLPFTNVLMNNPTIRFWISVITTIVLVFFGYQTPRFARIKGGVDKRDRISDNLLGFFIGALNGYLIVGSLWYFSAQAGYPLFGEAVIPPNATQPMGEATLNLMKYLPPAWLATYPLYYVIIAIAAAIFIIVVFV